MTHHELIDYVIRNANYLEADSFGFAHYRRPDYLVARYRGIEFQADDKLTHIAGAKVLVNKWVLANDRDLYKLENIQAHLASTFGAPNFHTLIKNWDAYVEKYKEAEQLAEPMWTGRPYRAHDFVVRSPEEKKKYYASAYNDRGSLVAKMRPAMPLKGTVEVSEEVWTNTDAIYAKGKMYILKKLGEKLDQQRAEYLNQKESN